MSDRYFVETPIVGPTAKVIEAEAHHLIHVMRAKRGEPVTLFDGNGAEFSARVERLGRSEVELEIVERRDINRESPRSVTLAVALPKGDRQRWLVEKLVELGTSRLVPLITSRSVAEPGDKAQERLKRFVIEASKQCGRNRLMQIDSPSDWQSFVETAGLPFPISAGRSSAANETSSSPQTLHQPPLHQPPPQQPPPHQPSLHAPISHASSSHAPLSHGVIDPTCIVADPYSPPTAFELIAANQAPLIAAVGSEGGLTDDELETARRAGWKLANLGPRILRVETAAIAVAVLGCR